ncbi:MAG: urease accessory protein UreF [Alkalinema sp. CACIAM 70d]|nr:MAG: urease accessory protein UreF [Alkalinema sp. CACIAM 70d]
MQTSGLLRLMQLVSPSLPVGAYSYSEGLETLVQRGTIANVEQLQHWLTQELTYGAVRLEAAVMLRSYQASQAGDRVAIEYWNQWLTAARDTEELRSQSLQMGRSLLRLFQDVQENLNSTQATDLETVLTTLDALKSQGCHFAIAFGLVASMWEVEETSTLLGYLHSWASNLVSAAIKLVPLGQTEGQRLLLALNPTIEQAAQTIVQLADGDLVSCGWGLSLASMHHETLYSRLFRS